MNPFRSAGTSVMNPSYRDYSVEVMFFVSCSELRTMTIEVLVHSFFFFFFFFLHGALVSSLM